ncbi:MAG: iron-containing alcohol dehydrogenase [Candidatus Methanomethyliales bacterium]|nr:iron-containing alcohol dehydrogenase [Candidatus Methanomethylicales archaeon]
MSTKFYHRTYRVSSFQAPTRVVFGPNSLDKLAEELKRFELKSVLLVSGKNVYKTEGYERVRSIISSMCPLFEFNEVIPEPDSSTLSAVASKAREVKPSLVVGFGGGSSLDMAKMASALSVNQKDPVSYFKGEPLVNKGPPVLTIPTLAGTGSEVTPISVVVEGNKKLAISHPFLYPSVTIVDPVLSVTAPPYSTASAGIDALCHALESFMSLDSNPITESLAFEAISLSDDYLERAYCNGEDLEARTGISLASVLAGMAFMNTGLCLAHGIAYTFAVKCQTPHGVSVAVAEPYVLEFNAPAIPDKLGAIAAAFGMDAVGSTPYEIGEAIAARMIEIMDTLNLPTCLQDLGLDEKELEPMVDDLMKNYSRFIVKNPRKPSREDLVELYQMIFEGY